MLAVSGADSGWRLCEAVERPTQLIVPSTHAFGELRGEIGRSIDGLVDVAHDLELGHDGRVLGPAGRDAFPQLVLIDQPLHPGGEWMLRATFAGSQARSAREDRRSASSAAARNAAASPRSHHGTTRTRAPPVPPVMSSASN
jgi:hypothetical protein